MSGVGRIATGFRTVGSMLTTGVNRARSLLRNAAIRNSSNMPDTNAASSAQRRAFDTHAASRLSTGLTNYRSLDAIFNDEPFDDSPQVIIIPPTDYKSADVSTLDSVSQSAKVDLDTEIPAQVEELIDSILDQSSMLEALLVLDGLDPQTRAESELAARRDAALSFGHAHDLEMQANQELSQGNHAKASDLQEEAQWVRERAMHLTTFANSLDNVYAESIETDASSSLSVSSLNEDIAVGKKALAEVLVNRVVDNASMRQLATELLEAEPELIELVVDDASYRAQAMSENGNIERANTLSSLVDLLERGMLLRLFERVVSQDSVNALVLDLKTQSSTLISKASEEALKKEKAENDKGNEKLANLFVSLANQLDNIGNVLDTSAINVENTLVITQDIVLEARGLVYSITNTESRSEIEAYLADAPLNLRLTVIDEGNTEINLLTNEGEANIANVLENFLKQQVQVASNEILSFIVDEDSAAQTAHAFSNAHLSLLNALYDLAWDASLNATDKGELELAQALVSFANDIDNFRQASTTTLQTVSNLQAQDSKMNSDDDIEDVVLQAEALIDALTDGNDLERLVLQLANAPQELVDAVIYDATEQSKAMAALGNQAMSALYTELVTKLNES